MRRTLINDAWTVRPKTGQAEAHLGTAPEPAEVTLPHDAMIGCDRSPEGNPANAYFPGGVWEYRRNLAVEGTKEKSTVQLAFEGVYRDAVVFVNDSVVGHWANGYSEFTVPIDHVVRFGQLNDIRVEARAFRDSRWYTGAGLYRDVWLLQAGSVYLAHNGLQVTTLELDDELAVLSVAVELVNRSAGVSRPTVKIEVLDDESVVAQVDAPVTTNAGDVLVVRQRLTVAHPRRWGPDHPVLYRCRASLIVEESVVDADESRFGLRSIAVDATRGLRVNGEPILLRGACVHHDNGPLGSATIPRAEERRVELLKAAGFNSLRSSHNPMSRPMLDACDRLGMLVVDETFDMWDQPKSDNDYALRFPDSWEADIEAMVRKDFNHPSVIMYSIGNEIPEVGTPQGARRGRELTELLRSLDGSRLVTEAVSGFYVGGAEMFASLSDRMSEHVEAGGDAVDEGSEVNTALTNLGEIMSELMLSPAVDRNSAEAFSYLDVAGYNYMESRLEIDAALHPHRVIVASETHAKFIDTGWAAVRRHPHVIGDFTWTGWDYLGEAGIGRVEYPQPGDAPAFEGAFPWLAAWCGDIDITGHRRPQSYYREIVFGLRTDPYIAVQRPEHHGKTAQSTPWSWSDSVASWSWDGHEGSAVTVEVYADADEIDLVINKELVSTAPAGPENGYRAVFETRYEPGHVEVVARTSGRETGRAALQSAEGDVLIDLEIDRAVISADPGDLALIRIRLVDASGTVHRAKDCGVEVAIEGPGVLQALGSANPAGDGRFCASSCTTFDGEALAIVRPTGSGAVTLNVTAESGATARGSIDVRN